MALNDMAPTTVAIKVCLKDLSNSIHTLQTNSTTELRIFRGMMTPGATTGVKINGLIKTGTHITTTIGHVRKILMPTIKLEILQQQHLQS